MLFQQGENSGKLAICDFFARDWSVGQNSTEKPGIGQVPGEE